MSTFVIVLITLLTLGVLYWWRKGSHNGKLPPGPRGLPILGNLHQLGTEPSKTFMKMGEKYGPIISLQMGMQRTVVLNNYADIRDALAMQTLSGRLINDDMLTHCGGAPRGILFNIGHNWHSQRRFTIKALREFGLFSKMTVESIILTEVSELIETFKTTVGQPIITTNRFNPAVLNCLWTIVAGERFAHDDPTLVNIIDNLSRLMSQHKTAALSLFFPFLVRIRKMFPGKYEKLLVDVQGNILKCIRQSVERHQASRQSVSELRDFIDTYLNEIEDTTDPDSSFYQEEGLKNLTTVLFDLFVAGSESTSTTMCWTFLLLAIHQDVQEKMYQEIRLNVGHDRLPSLIDKERLPYVEAVINEVQRFAAITPLGFPHTATEDTKFRDYIIPKGTLVFTNIYSALHSPQVWNTPSEFKPERFLSDGNLVKPEAHIPFSTGKRVCLGMPLAQDVLFLFTTSLFQKFKVGPDPLGEPLSPSYTSGTLLIPNPHNLVLTQRLAE